MFSKIAALNLLVLSASATALPAESQLYKWAVHGFASTCTAATCRYTFNVSGSTGPSNQPAFDASCYGNSVQGGFKSCAIVGIDAPGDVQTQEENFGTDIGAVISVQYTFEQNNIKYTYTGGNAVAHTSGGPAVEFEIIPTEVHAVPA